HHTPFVSLVPSSSDYIPHSLHDALPIYMRTGSSVRSVGSLRDAVASAVLPVSANAFDSSASSSSGSTSSPPSSSSMTLMPMSERDRKSTRLNSSHVKNSYLVYCLNKKIQ